MMPTFAKLRPLLFAASLGALAVPSAYASDGASDTDLSQEKTLKLCLAYNGLSDASEKKRYLKELDRRAQLSVTDHDNLDTVNVEPGATACGMYMALGKPLQEEGRQLRPMVYKVVHVYPDHYYVTQSGLVMEKLERIEGELPPKLTEEKPRREGPPIQFNAPGGTH